MLKEFQISCLIDYGNTIISKKYEPQEIINECKRQGFEVNVREFNTWVDPTHYVVEVK